MCPTRRAGLAEPFDITGVVEQSQVNRDYQAFIDIIRKRRSVRHFGKGMLHLPRGAGTCYR